MGLTSSGSTDLLIFYFVYEFTVYFFVVREAHELTKASSGG